MKFKDLQDGTKFRLVGEVKSNSGQESMLNGVEYVLVKVPFMRNFYNTTKNKRNARLLESTSKMNQKYFYIDESQDVITV